MPEISKKAHSMPSSPIRRLVPYADKAAADGVRIIRLNIGQPDIHTPTPAIDAVRAYNEPVYAYSHSAGILSLRKRIVEYYANIGVELTTDEILVTTGGSEALTLAFQVCIDPGERVIIPEPFYANYTAFATQAGVIVDPIHSTIDNDFALPRIEEFERLITPTTRAIVLCNPGNPTGTLYSREELEQLAEIVKRHDLYLICDEVYREFCYDGKEHYSVMKLKGLERNVILIDSASKRYSMCGVRIGALVTRNKDVTEAALKFAQARLSPPLLGQIAVEAAHDIDEDYFNRVHDEYVARRNTLVEGLNSIEGVYSPMPTGAFYTMVRLPIDDCDRFARWLLEEVRVNNTTVMIAPGSGFYNTMGEGRNQARLAYVLCQEDLREAVEILRQALAVYPGRTNR